MAKKKKGFLFQKGFKIDHPLIHNENPYDSCCLSWYSTTIMLLLVHFVNLWNPPGTEFFIRFVFKSAFWAFHNDLPSWTFSNCSRSTGYCGLTFPVSWVWLRRAIESAGPGFSGGFRKPEFYVLKPLLSGSLQRGGVWECWLNVNWKNDAILFYGLDADI